MPNFTKAELERIKRKARCEGIRKGRRRSQKLVNQLNAALIENSEALSTIDWQYPRTGVTLCFDMAEQMISALRGKESRRICSKLARQLRELYDDAYCEIGEPMQECKDELLQVLER